MIHHRLPVLSLATLCLVLASCSEEKIRTYRVAVVDFDEKPAPSAPAESPKSIRWQVPENWGAQEPGQFQQARYRLRPECEVSISALPGDAGGADANVNRWREQIGLPAVTKPEGERIEIKTLAAHATLYELRGASKGILAAILSHGDQTWFFKLNSPVAELDSCRGEFLTFLTGIQGGPATPPPPPKLPPTPEKPRINLDVPDGWVKSEGSSMRVASFSIPGSGGVDGDVSVIPLMGDGGNTLDNVNRWRQQLKLPELKADDDPATWPTLETPSGPAIITHMVSEEAISEGNRPGATSAAILRAGGVTWFFKLTGDAELVRQNKEKFEAFVRSAILP
ncbi:hypothetical protein OKA05_21680 [Luteolibacter arcticus]|uniref:Uncharacterized protein n=1 Tax=Luteolibacter arcticus TaxID=1581411 RepID=A0ABT3GNT3_9BACT|nr:hypothetical protein [Luteolibacter arcticus]MCW1925186.1 hypothetical protein [Luteolibacter arcticus]